MQDVTRTLNYAAEIERKLALKDECRRILEMPHFMAMLEKGIDMADSAIDNTTDPALTQRHVGAKKALKDLRNDIRKMSDFKVPETRKEVKPQYE